MARLAEGPLRLRVLSGAALLSSVAVLVTAVWAADRHPNDDPTGGDMTRIGVAEGQSIDGYVQSTRNRLAALLTATPSSRPSETYALVTMSTYLAPDRLAPVLAGAGVSEVFSRVPLPDTQTQIVRIPALHVPDDVVAGMAQVAERKDREARDYQHRSAALVGDGAQERQMRRMYDSSARVAIAEATAYRSHCSCLYAAVVRAAPGALQKMASRREVRAVDPAPEVSRLDRAVFTPPLPEQDELFHPPADGSPPPGGGGPASKPPVPSGSPSGQPPTPAPSTSPASPTPGPTHSPQPTPVPPSTDPPQAVPSADPPRAVPSGAGPPQGATRTESPPAGSPSPGS
jgi:hypothetical protein